MAQNSKIEWCNHTVNLWWGCTKVHEGCDHCYAETLSNRWGNDVWGNDKSRKEIKSAFNDLSKYQKLAKEANEIHRVFVGSMMDIFEKPMPLVDSKGQPLAYKTDWLRSKLFVMIHKGWFNNLMFLFLTKRPSNINKYIPENWKTNPPENVMFGTSPVNQATAQTLIAQLSLVNGKRFISLEPQLASADLSHNYFNHKKKIAEPLLNCLDWVIQGGESGAHKRPFNLEWAYDMKNQCEAANTPYFFKQIDKIQPIPEDLQIRQFPRKQTTT